MRIQAIKAIPAKFKTKTWYGERYFPTLQKATEHAAEHQTTGGEIYRWNERAGWMLIATSLNQPKLY